MADPVLAVCSENIRSYLSPSTLWDRQTTINSNVLVTFEEAFLKNQTTSKVHFCSNVRPPDVGGRPYILPRCFLFYFYYFHF